MSRLEKLRVLGQIVCLVVAGAAFVAACGDYGYLAIVGPPSLRFASSGAHEKFAPTLFSLIDTNLAKDANLSFKTSDGETNSFPIPTNAVPVTSVVMRADSTPSPPSVPALNFAPGGTADQSIVTSAMLMDFLKPTEGGGNRRDKNSDSAVILPMNPAFLPPTVAPTAENTSRAVYKSE